MTDKTHEKSSSNGTCIMSGAPRRALIVLGMHRSGTSVLSALLCNAGADRPINLVGANEFNATGHWEPAHLPLLHDELLDAMGVAWHTTGVYPVEFLASPAAEPFKRRLADMLSVEYPNSTLFCIKDPRTSRLLPLWIPVLRDLGIEARYVIAVRNPLEVAASLARRDGMSLGVATLLWLRYTIEAEVATRGYARVFVTYDQLMSDWRGVLQRIGHSLDIEWPREMSDIERDFNELISESLRHHRAPPDERNNEEPADWVLQVFDACRAAAQDGATIDSDVIDRVERDMRSAARIFASLPPPFVEQDARIKVEAANASLAIAEDRSRVLQEELEITAAELKTKCSEIESVRAKLRAQHEVDAKLGHLSMLQQDFTQLQEVYVATRERLARLQYNAAEIIGGMSVVAQRLTTATDHFASSIPEIDMLLAQMRAHLMDGAPHSEDCGTIFEPSAEPERMPASVAPTHVDRLTILEAQFAQMRAELALTIEEFEELRQMRISASDSEGARNA